MAQAVGGFKKKKMSDLSLSATRHLPWGVVAEKRDILSDLIPLLLHDAFRYPHQIADFLRVQEAICKKRAKGCWGEKHRPTRERTIIKNGRVSTATPVKLFDPSSVHVGR